MNTQPSLLFLFSIVFIETVFCSVGYIIKPLKLTGWECYQVRITEPPPLTEENRNKFWTRKSSFMTPEQLFVVSKGNQDKDVFHLNQVLEKVFALADEDSKHEVTLYFSDFSDFTLPNGNEVGIPRLNDAVELIYKKLSNDPELALVVLLSDIGEDGKINDTAFAVFKRVKADVVDAKNTGARSDVSSSEERKSPSKNSEQTRKTTINTAGTTVPTSTPKTTQPQQSKVPTNTSTKKKPETEKIDIAKIILKINTKPYKEALKGKRNSWEDFVFGIGVFLGVITFVSLVYYLMTELSKEPEVEL